MTDHDLFAKFWSEAWTDGLWAASWAKSVEGLTPEQAFWSPAPGRHSIWQIVMHMVYWRETWLTRVATGRNHTPEQYEAGNFPAPPPATDPAARARAWSEAVRRLAETHTRIAAALAAGRSASDKYPTDSLMYFLPHDSYHFGQINYLRAMQGLKPIE